MTVNPTTKTLIVCDVQPDVVKKLPESRLFCDLVNLTVQAARVSGVVKIVYTQLYFGNGYDCIAASHPKLGILKKLPNAKWFTSKELCVGGDTSNNERDECRVIRRTTYLPQANDTELLEALRPASPEDHSFTVIGYGPTVQAICGLLGDVLACPHVQVIRDCVRDDTQERCQAFLQNGLIFKENVIDLIVFLEELDLLHKPIPDIPPLPSSSPPANQYVCDVGRGGHITLFLPYLKQKYNYVEWPKQPWYQQRKSFSENKQYFCPLGRQLVPLCDEPQFGTGPRFFLLGRQYLDEKDLLYQIVPELLPPTFSTLQEAEKYASTHNPSLWFLKKVNQNGGRAVDVLTKLPIQPLENDDQLQAHIPKPLLWEGTTKCHVKTYYYLSTIRTQDNAIQWQLYLHDLYWLAIADQPWNPNDPSDACQITTMRRQRLYHDHPWRQQHTLTERCSKHLTTVVTKAVEQNKLQVPDITNNNTNKAPCTLQFEINSADWMLDEDDNMYLIECNGIPVLYDPKQSHPLWTRGLKLYDGLYKANPETAVVDDHALLRDAVDLAMTTRAPETSLWKLVATIPAA